MSTLRATLFAALLFLAACRRGQTGPDANYEKAQRIYQQLYASELDDAYADPKMDAVVALLKNVEPSSIDAEAAERMLGAIQSGRETLAKQQAERERRTSAAQQSVTNYPAIDPQKIIAASTPDAGMSDPYGNGASVAEINAATGGCLQDGEPFHEQGTGATGTVYRLARSQQCADRMPGFMGQVVLVVNGRIYRRTADPTPAQAPTPIAPPKTTPAAAADAAPSTTAAAAPAPPAPAAPAPQAAAAPAASNDNAADAGEPYLYSPGQALPDGVTQAPTPPGAPSGQQ